MASPRMAPDGRVSYGTTPPYRDDRRGQSIPMAGGGGSSLRLPQSMTFDRGFPREPSLVSPDAVGYSHVGRWIVQGIHAWHLIVVRRVMNLKEADAASIVSIRVPSALA